MADQSDAASHGDGVPVRRPYAQSGFKFRRRAARTSSRSSRPGATRSTPSAAISRAADRRRRGAAAERRGTRGCSASSFSGGGIRSATLNLGVLQGLAGCGVLRYVDYLSTVSGGGYIGSWLTALSQRRFARTADGRGARGRRHDLVAAVQRRNGFKSFEKGLAWSAGDGGRDGAEREDRAIRFLREFSNYLTPKLGMFSGDTWALIAIYLRNALLNQLVLLLRPRRRAAGPAAAVAVRRLSVEAGESREFLAVDGARALIVLSLHRAGTSARISRGVTAPRGAQRRASTAASFGGIGVPLLLIGISGASWLGYLGTWLAAITGADPSEPTDWRMWSAAAVVGALLNFVTWGLRVGSGAACGARLRRASSRRLLDATWSGTRAVAGAVFGLLLHAVEPLALHDDVDALLGLQALAAPPALALAILLAGVLHIGLAGKNVSAQYTEWLSRLGGLMLIGAFGWIAFNGLVFLGPLLVAWLQGLWEAAVSSGWLLTTVVSVVFGRSVAASSGECRGSSWRWRRRSSSSGSVSRWRRCCKRACIVGAMRYGERRRSRSSERREDALSRASSARSRRTSSVASRSAIRRRGSRRRSLEGAAATAELRHS